MKKTVLTIIISLILMLCLISCGKWSMELKRPGEGEALPENSGELSGGEDLAPITPENSEEALRVPEDLNYTITNLYDGFFPLRDLDLTVAAENLVLAGDGRHFSYDLSLTNGAGKSLVLPGEGVYFFYSDNSFASYTGGFCGSAEDLYYCSLGYAAKIDLIAMKATPTAGLYETENDRLDKRRYEL